MDPQRRSEILTKFNISEQEVQTHDDPDMLLEMLDCICRIKDILDGRTYSFQSGVLQAAICVIASDAVTTKRTMTRLTRFAERLVPYYIEQVALAEYMSPKAKKLD